MENLNQLLQSLIGGKCILFLGQGANCVEDAQGNLVPIAQAFIQKEMATNPILKGLNLDTHQRFNLGYISQQLIFAGEDPTKLVNRLVGFMNRESTPQKWHQLLAEMPFPLIIDTNADQAMFEAMEGATTQAFTRETTYRHWYNFRQQANTSPVDIHITSTTPLVYHILGCCDDDTASGLSKGGQSIVLTEQDAIDFTTAIVKNAPPIPSSILNIIQNPNIGSRADIFYLFLGFDYESYYLRMLLKNLNLVHNSENLTYSPVSYIQTSSSNQKFYSNVFKIKFAAEDVSHFVEDLHKAYLDYTQGGEGNAVSSKSTNVVVLAHPTDNASEGVAQPGYHSFGVELTKHLNNVNGFRVTNLGHYLSIGSIDQSTENLVQTADIVVFLISVDFVNWLSEDYAMDNLLNSILDRYDNDEVKIVPILARSLDLDKLKKWIKNLSKNMLSRNEKGELRALAEYADTAQRDKVYTEIIKKIKDLI